jgi:DNA-binding beta-propeller fold protein YncE
MHRIENNASCAFGVRGLGALGAVVVLAVAFSPALAKADDDQHTTFTFVTASAASNVWMIDMTTHRVVAQIPKEGPIQTVVSADGKTRYSVDDNKSAVLVFQTGEDEPKSIRVGRGPSGLAISLDGKKLFVFSRIANTISVIDTHENEVVEVDPAPAYHFGINVTADGHLMSVK